MKHLRLSVFLAFVALSHSPAAFALEGALAPEPLWVGGGSSPGRATTDPASTPSQPGRVLELGAGDERQAPSLPASTWRVLELGAGDERGPLAWLLALVRDHMVT